MILFFVSAERLDNRVLSPRIPDNFLTRNGFEDNVTKRVCLSKSIAGCLKGLSRNLENEELYVHSVNIDKSILKIPTIEEVPDSKLTGEVWSLKSVRLSNPEGKIKITGVGDEFSYILDGKSIKIYGWKFKWLIKGPKYFTEAINKIYKNL